MPVGYVGSNVSGLSQQLIPFVTNGYVDQANVLVNSQQYYDNNLVQPHDLWEVFEEQTIGHGFKDNLSSIISYTDWLTNYRYNVYDLTRIKNRLKNPSESVNLSIRCTAAKTPIPGALTSGQFDNLFIVERQTIADIVFTSGNVNIAIGSAAL